MFFTKCGDSYYFYEYEERARVIYGIEEWKGLTVDLLTDKVSTADRLNGTQWSGNIRMFSEAHRYYRFSQPTWSKWWNNPDAIIYRLG